MKGRRKFFLNLFEKGLGEGYSFGFHVGGIV
jgi:hypothetical protein